MAPTAVRHRLRERQDLGVPPALERGDQLLYESDTQASIPISLRDGGRPVTIAAMI